VLPLHCHSTPPNRRREPPPPPQQLHFEPLKTTTSIPAGRRKNRGRERNRG